MSASVSLGATIRRANSGFVAMLRCYALRRICHPERKRQCGWDRGVPRRLASIAEKVGRLVVAAAVIGGGKVWKQSSSAADDGGSYKGEAKLQRRVLRYVLRTSSCRRRIQCNNPSSARIDPIKTLVLKTNTSTFIPKYCLYWPKNTFGFPPRR